jgi:hypothetical protein
MVRLAASDLGMRALLLCFALAVSFGLQTGLVFAAAAGESDSLVRWLWDVSRS